MKSKENVGTEIKITLKLARSGRATGTSTSFPARQHTKDKIVRLMGFDIPHDEESPSRISDPISRGRALLGRSVASCCKLTFDMKLWDAREHHTADLIVAPLVEAQQNLATLLDYKVPVLLICPDPGASEDFSRVHGSEPGAVLHCISQP